jgi:hypothetical protein
MMDYMDYAQAQEALTKALYFRVVGMHVEFLDSEYKVKGVRPIEGWMKMLWEECIKYRIELAGVGHDSGKDKNINN